jgi:hypothetical protein
MSKNTEAIVFSLAVLAGGVGLLIFLTKCLEIDEPATTLAALLLIPFAVYGVATGTFSKFSYAGFSFETAANKSVEAARTPISAANKFQSVRKGDINPIPAMAGQLDKGQPVVIFLQLGKTGPDGSSYYDETSITEYVNQFRSVDPELMIAVVTPINNFVASLEGKTFLDWSPEQRTNFVEAITRFNVEYIQGLPGVASNAVSQRSSNADALKLMAKLKTKVLLYVDDSSKPEAVVKRDDVVAEMVQTLVTA